MGILRAMLGRFIKILQDIIMCGWHIDFYYVTCDGPYWNFIMFNAWQRIEPMMSIHLLN